MKIAYVKIFTFQQLSSAIAQSFSHYICIFFLPEESEMVVFSRKWSFTSKSITVIFDVVVF